MYAPEITSEYPNIDASESADAWADATINVYEKFSIECPLHVWENGFVQGEASDAELEILVHQTNSANTQELFEKLNAALEAEYRSALGKIN